MTGFWRGWRSKTYAVLRDALREACTPRWPTNAFDAVARCVRTSQPECAVSQGNPAPLALFCALLAALIWPVTAHAAPPAGHSRCPGPLLRIETLAPGLWWVPAFAGEANAANRGQVSNLVLAADPVDGRRLWLLGSGPSPAFGRRLACQVRQHLGRPVTDVVSPWARPELVLGTKGLAAVAPVRHWAHAEVAAAMAEQCPHCVQRLRVRLGAAAADLGPAPIPRPARLLRGEQGRLGPWQWWRLPRSDGRVVTVWRAQAMPLWVAPGLLSGAGGSGPPDGRDADLALLAASAGRLAQWAAADGGAARFLGEQGEPQDAGAPHRTQAYWLALRDAARAAIERGESDTAPAPAWTGLPEGWASHPWHALNWQRAWRQVEPEVLAAPAK